MEAKNRKRVAGNRNYTAKNRHFFQKNRQKMAFRPYFPARYWTIANRGATESDRSGAFIAPSAATDSYTLLTATVAFASSTASSLTFTDTFITGQSAIFYRLRVTQQ